MPSSEEALEQTDPPLNALVHARLLQLHALSEQRSELELQHRIASRS